MNRLARLNLRVLNPVQRRAFASAAPIPALQGRARRLEGKFVVVAGGTQGLGEAIAYACAEEGAAGVAICGRSEVNGGAVAQNLEKIGTKALYVKADLTSVADTENFIAMADQSFGRIDGLVNSAAVSTRGDWGQVTEAMIDRLYKLNFRAPFMLTQAASEIMKREGKGGSIVNIGSINGHGGQSNLPAYSCTKGALMTMTKHASWALRKDLIRANYVAVGWMYTPAEDAMMKSEGMDEDWIEKADAAHPYGRLLRPADISKLVVHLLSDDACMQSGGIIDYHENYGICCWDGQPEA